MILKYTLVVTLGYLMFWNAVAFGSDFVSNQTLLQETQPTNPKINFPSGNQLAQWLGFSKPVVLEQQFIERGDYTAWGAPVAIAAYQSKETLHGYVIAIYKKGTLFTDQRQGMINALENQVRSNNQSSEDLKKLMHIEERPDGRKVYFTVLGFGPGGVIVGAFSFLSDYDLLVTEAASSDYAIPEDEELKLARPGKDLSSLMLNVEEFIYDNKE